MFTDTAIILAVHGLITILWLSLIYYHVCLLKDNTLGISALFNAFNLCLVSYLE